MAKYRVITEDSAVAFNIEADTFVPDYDNSEYAFVKGEEVVARVSIYRTVGVVKQNAS